MLPDKYTSFARLPMPFSKFALFPAEPVRSTPIVFSGKGAAWYRDRSREQMPGAIEPLGIYLFSDTAVSVQGRPVMRDGHFAYAPDLFDGYSMDRFADLDWRRYQAEAMQALPSPDSPRFLIAKPGHLAYGHWLLDMLPQIWLARLAGARFYPEMADLPVLIEAQTPSWARTMMALGLGLPAASLHEYDERAPPRRYARLLVPSMLRRNSALSSRMNLFVAEVLHRLGITPAAIAASTLPRRFYAIRDSGRSRPPGAGDRGVAQEEELLRICHDHGVAVIDPATLPWRDQVLLFAGADLVVGPCGSGMHNLIFTPAGARGIVLANRFMNWLQSSIAAVRGQHLTYIFEEEEIADGALTRSRYAPDLLHAALDDAGKSA